PASIGRVDSHVVMWSSTNPPDPIDDYLIDIIADDGGNGDAMWAVGNEVAEVARLSAKHFVGKIVRIRPKKADAEDAYYMRAEPRIAGSTHFTGVTWVECAGVEIQPTGAFCFATVEDDT